MTNKDVAIETLNKYGYSIMLAQDNYKEVKKTIIEALDLADKGNYHEAKIRAGALADPLHEEIAAIIEKKGRKE